MYDVNIIHVRNYHEQTIMLMDPYEQETSLEVKVFKTSNLKIFNNGIYYQNNRLADITSPFRLRLRKLNSAEYQTYQVVQLYNCCTLV